MTQSISNEKVNQLIGGLIGGAFEGITGTLINIGVNFVVDQLDQWIRKDEILIEQAQMLQAKYDEVKENVQQNVQTLSSLEEEYDTLNKKFQSGNLNTEESERYRDIVQQIAEISPSLVEGYDAEGNAIIRKNDALKESIRLKQCAISLLTERQTSRETRRSPQSGQAPCAACPGTGGRPPAPARKGLLWARADRSSERALPPAPRCSRGSGTW